MTNSEARERVLAAAEKLFVERGYEAVTVKDIAQEVGIHHASLYHHVSGGKSALFVEVMVRHMERHRQGINEAVQAAGDNLRAQLQGIAAWFLSQPPVDIVRLTRSDLPAIGGKDAYELSHLTYSSTMVPIFEVLEAAQIRGEIHHPNLGSIAGAIFASVEGIHSIPPPFVNRSRQFMANELIDVFIRGLSVL